MVLRVAVRPSAVRSWNHLTKALSFWKRRNRHASCSMPRRTRHCRCGRDPSRAAARRFGRAPGHPAITCHSPSVAQVTHQHLVHQHVRGLDANRIDARQQRPHGVPRNVPSWSRAASDLLRSFGCGMWHSVDRFLERRLCLCFTAHPIASCTHGRAPPFMPL